MNVYSSAPAIQIFTPSIAWRLIIQAVQLCRRCPLKGLAGAVCAVPLPMQWQLLQPEPTGQVLQGCMA